MRKTIKKIAIHSVPRSGSSWLGQIFNSSPKVNFKFQPLFSYAFKDALNEKSTQEDIDTFFAQIAKSDDSFLLQQDKIDKGVYPVFSKDADFSHIVYKEVRYHHILENMMAVHPDIIVIGLVRNPYAVINSFLNAPREFRKDLGWDAIEEWREAKKKNLGKPEEFFGYERWKETTLLFQKLRKEHPHRFYLLKYDDLLANTSTEVEKMFRFCGIKLEEQTVAFLNESTKRNHEDVYSVYKNKEVDDSWKDSLNPTIIKEITQDLKKCNLTEYIKTGEGN